MTFLVRHATPADAPTWGALRMALWPDGADDHAKEIALYFKGQLDEPIAVLFAENEAPAVVGVAELSIRRDLAGYEGKAVGYVEGLYVPPAYRHQGVARLLLQASRDWARERNCEAFASDRAGRIVMDKTFSAD